MPLLRCALCATRRSPQGPLRTVFPTPHPTLHTPGESASRLLIIAPSWIGDTVAAQTLFMRIASRYPNAVIDALAPPWVAAVLRAMPQINGEVLDNPFAHGQLRLKARWKLARQLRVRSYDAAYVLPNSLKSALIPFLAGIPLRIGFTGESRYGLINVRHTLDTAATPLQVERYAILAEKPGEALPRPYPLPSLSVDAAETTRTLDSLNLHRSPAPVVFCPGAEFGPAKRWPERHFAELARQLAARGIPAWLLGSKKDAAVGEEIVRLAEGAARNLCGITNLAQAVQLLSIARHVVTNDSGLMHVAAALGTPLTALFGSSSPGYTPPLSDVAQVVSLNLSCSPCFKRECPLGHLDCLNKITPEQIGRTLQ
jgi:heptosyltransferase-2